MPLINCPDCNTEVSDRAPACLKCGAPIASAKEVSAVGTKLTTTQSTSKQLKLESLIASAVLIAGVLITIASSGPSPFGALVIFIGLIWFIVTRIRIWWHHG